MNIDNAFPSNYIKSSELHGDTVFTVQSVEIQTLGRGKDQETKPVVHFEETDKALALNKTNANTIKALYGSDTDGWTGRKIVLFPTEVEFAGEMVMAIRVRKSVPAVGTATRRPAPPAAPAGPNPKARAWAEFQRTYRSHVPAGSPADCAAAWKESLAAYFPGREMPASIRDEEWDQFVADAFTPPPTPVAAGPRTVTDDDIPF